MFSHDSDSRDRSAPWHWKAPDLGAGGHAGLLYEPGNWGDLLKDAWVVRIVEACCQAKRGTSLRILDPFAGSPRYPLSDSARNRVEAIADVRLSARLAEYTEKNMFPSPGLLALAVATRSLSSARLLVDARAAVDLPDGTGTAPLTLCAALGLEDCAALYSH